MRTQDIWTILKFIFNGVGKSYRGIQMEENGKKFQNIINIIFVSLAFHIVAFFFWVKLEL